MDIQATEKGWVITLDGESERKYAEPVLLVLQKACPSLKRRNAELDRMMLMLKQAPAPETSPQ